MNWSGKPAGQRHHQVTKAIHGIDTITQSNAAAAEAHRPRRASSSAPRCPASCRPQGRWRPCERPCRPQPGNRHPRPGRRILSPWERVSRIFDENPGCLLPPHPYSARRQAWHAGMLGLQRRRGKKKLAIFIDVCAVWKHNIKLCPCSLQAMSAGFSGYLFFSFCKECMYGSWS